MRLARLCRMQYGLKLAIYKETEKKYQPGNPLEVRAALFFSVLFVAVMVLTRVAVFRQGKIGLYGLASFIGFMDADPFVLGVTQSAGT